MTNATATRVTVELPLKLGRGLNDREHWRARHNRVEVERELTHWEVASALRVSMFSFGRGIVVTMTRQSFGTLDDDNLQGACKAVRDGISDAFGVPDNDARITWRYAQERCKRGAYGVRVEIEHAETHKEEA